ncbi:MAG TPA: hypothetical protein VFZ37_03640 [Jiangellaceae bacterium]
MVELCELIPEEALAALDRRRLPEAVWERPEWRYTSVIAQWQSLAPMTRVLFGKIIAMKENSLYDEREGDVSLRASHERRDARLGRQSVAHSTPP